MTIGTAKVDGLVRRLRRMGVGAVRIGTVSRGEAGLVDGDGAAIAVSAVDEIGKLYA